MRKRDTRPYRPYGGRKRRHPVLGVILCVILILSLAFIGMEIYIRIHDRTEINGEPEVMVIFGCQVMPWGPSTTLQDRLDTALPYLAAHPGMTVVLTGGQGDNEHISEAQCMYDYLTAHGIAGENLLLEEKSTTTWENIQYTRDLLKSRNIDAKNVLLVSNGFHLARIKLLWARGWHEPYTLSTLSAPTSHFPTRLKMFFREPISMVLSFVTER